MRSSFFIYLTFCLSFLVKAAEITATTTTSDDATTDTETSSSSVSPTMIWVTGTLSGALATYQTVYSQSFMPTYTSGTVISSGAPDASSYDYSSAKASASSASAAASSSSSGSAAFSASNAVAWIQAAVVASTMVVVVAMLL